MSDHGTKSVFEGCVPAEKAQFTGFVGFFGMSGRSQRLLGGYYAAPKPSSSE